MYRIPLVFTPQPEGGDTVTSPALPELITEGDTLEEAQENVQDAFDARGLAAGVLRPRRDAVVGGQGDVVAARPHAFI